MLRKTMTAVAALAASLALAPATAMGKTTKFTGPIVQAHYDDPFGFPHPDPVIELKVNFQGKTPKLVPFGTLRTKGIYGYCKDFGEGTGPYFFSEDFNNDLKIKKNKFKGTINNEADDDFPKDEGVFLRVVGRVTKKTVTGTVRSWIKLGGSSDPVLGQPPTECDTGPLKFTATR